MVWFKAQTMFGIVTYSQQITFMTDLLVLSWKMCISIHSLISGVTLSEYFNIKVYFLCVRASWTSACH